MMHMADAEWIEKCRATPEKYKICVDNDSIFVVDAGDKDVVWHDFLEYGYHFARDLLEYIGCTAEFV